MSTNPICARCGQEITDPHWLNCGPPENPADPQWSKSYHEVCPRERIDRTEHSFAPTDNDVTVSGPGPARITRSELAKITALPTGKYCEKHSTWRVVCPDCEVERLTAVNAALIDDIINRLKAGAPEMVEATCRRIHGFVCHKRQEGDWPVCPKECCASETYRAALIAALEKAKEG